MPRYLNLLLIVTLLAACNNATETPATPTLPPSVVSTVAVTDTPAPTPTQALSDPRSVAEAYTQAWQAGDYATMYSLLADESRAQLSEVDFTAQYTTVLNAMTVLSFTLNLGDVHANGAQAEVNAQVNYSTALVSTFTAPITLTLKQSGTQWGMVFARTAILAELTGDNRLLMVPLIPDRGTIYDRNGVPLAYTADVYSFGVVPGELGEGFEAAVRGLSGLLGIPSSILEARFNNAVQDQYLALGETSATEYLSRYRYLSDMTGVYVYSYNSRYYAGQGAAASVTGYTTFIPQDQLAAYQARGYSGSERVGVAGLEQWGESVLAGKAGGQLQLRDANLAYLKTIAATQFVASHDIYSTIDYDLQQAAQFALGDLPGAVVVMNPQTGEVLALASNPTFSPNIFEPQNRNQTMLSLVLNDPRRPLLNHAAQSSYPAGSVFKIVTMAAGLTSGQFTADTIWDCTGTWEELGPTFIRNDWLERGHGPLTLKQGLTGSCNPWFWHIGYTLFNFNPKWLPDTAKAFGLGARTGIQIDENPGQIPDPDWKQRVQGEAWTVFDNLNLAIGQGDVLVTPVQIVRMVGAVANGGTLYQPQLVLKVQAADPQAAPTFSLQPVLAGALPVLPDQLAAIQEGMQNVPREPIGTARNVFRNFRIPLAGKTGTAEDPGVGGQEPDAWFAGYTYAGRNDLPDIALAVVVQNQGQGSEYAAPIFRRVVEAYFGLNYTRYPWEAAVGVPKGPEETPTPEP